MVVAVRSAAGGGLESVAVDILGAMLAFAGVEGAVDVASQDPAREAEVGAGRAAEVGSVALLRSVHDEIAAFGPCQRDRGTQRVVHTQQGAERAGQGRSAKRIRTGSSAHGVPLDGEQRERQGDRPPRATEGGNGAPRTGVLTPILIPLRSSCRAGKADWLALTYADPWGLSSGSSRSGRASTARP